MSWILKRWVKVKLKVLVVQSCPTLCDPMDCSQPGSSVHIILQARILEQGATPFSREPPWPRDGTCVSCGSHIGRQVLYHQEPPGDGDSNERPLHLPRKGSQEQFEEVKLYILRFIPCWGWGWRQRQGQIWPLVLATGGAFNLQQLSLYLAQGRRWIRICEWKKTSQTSLFLDLISLFLSYILIGFLVIQPETPHWLIFLFGSVLVRVLQGSRTKRTHSETGRDSCDRGGWRGPGSADSKSETQESQWRGSLSSLMTPDPRRASVSIWVQRQKVAVPAQQPGRRSLLLHLGGSACSSNQAFSWLDEAHTQEGGHLLHSSKC